MPLVLQPATRVHGKVTIGENRRPLAAIPTKTPSARKSIKSASAICLPGSRLVRRLFATRRPRKNKNNAADGIVSRAARRLIAIGRYARPPSCRNSNTNLSPGG